ncbi:response regulator [Halalkalibacter kiskunsagensis]|uniref:Response regulator n=1 Tax=Halalkalibacter kiskunsagensis TaxID=1548599 RepID=A0ABV6KD54_9BACI
MNKIKTIIVDDEIRIRRGVERLLKKDGDQWDIIGTFSDGIEVIEFLKQNPTQIELLITDVKMPEMDGLTLIKEINKLNPNTKYSSIIVSGYDDFQFLQTAIREGVSDYILKPIDRIEFAELLNKVKENIHEQRKRNFQWNDLVKQANKLSTTKQTQLLRDAMSSKPEDIAMMYWVKDFPDGIYQLLYVSTDEFPAKTKEYTPKDWQTMTYAVENIVDEFTTNFSNTNQENRGWWWRESGFHFWILLFNPKLEEDEFYERGREFSNDLKSSIQLYTRFRFSIAQSYPFEDISVLSEMKKQLQSTIRMKMLVGGNKVFPSLGSNEMETGKEKSTITVEVKELLNKLINMIGSSNTTEFENELHSLFKYVTKFQSPLEIEYTIQYIIVHMYRVCMENLEPSVFMTDLDEMVDSLKTESNLFRFKHLLKQLVLQVHYKHIAYQENHTYDPIVKAKLWIQENYREKITIKEISEMVYMNPTYFCQYFKKQTGQTVLDYITDLRLKKAKEMLQETELKVTEISSLLGYQDTKYFSRLFKQKWNRSPSEFKKYHK